VWYWLVRNRHDADTKTVMEQIWQEAGQFFMDDHSLEKSLLSVKRKIRASGRKSHNCLNVIPGNTKIKLPEKRKRRYWLTAACLALLIASSMFIVLNNRFSHSDNISAFVGQPMPSDDIQLISGKNVLKLSQDAQIALNKEGKASFVNKTEKSEIILSKKVMNRLIVPYGKRSTLQLSDGTRVWMNSGTELEFPSGFTGSTRDITLKGEIYIEVARDESKPFYIHASGFKIQVLGTKFNVSAYPDNSDKTIVLVEGEVEVNAAHQGTGKLAPNEMFTIGKDGMRKQKADVTRYISWKDGILILNKTPISEVLQKIGRYYNVSFDDYSDEFLSSKTCTGKLYLSENLDEVLMSVALLSRTVYFKHDGIIYIRNKLN
jgi:hypothetical protein